MRGSSLNLVETVAERLGPELCAEVAFLGGATIELLLTDPAVDEVRVTKDVDVITTGRSRAAFLVGFAQRLRERGFREGGEGAYRWKLGELIVDVMPASVLAPTACALHLAWLHDASGWTLARPRCSIGDVPLFRVTKKLATALKLKLPSAPIEAPPPVAHEWFADLFYVQGKKCVVWVHRETLLTFVRPAVVAAELREFHALFRYEFRTVVASMGLSEALVDRFGVYHPEAYAPTDDRRIVGSMLDYRKMFELMVECEGGLPRADVVGLNAQLNQTPMSVLKMDSAAEAVRALAGALDTLH